jgi:hypothetical protein
VVFTLSVRGRAVEGAVARDAREQHSGYSVAPTRRARSKHLKTAVTGSLRSHKEGYLRGQTSRCGSPSTTS